MTETSLTPSSSRTAAAAWTWGAPPSTTYRLGGYANFFGGGGAESTARAEISPDVTCTAADAAASWSAR
ncbi:Uncharacterised protein [Mycobacteroides abscessus subsp. abscessus]|nr:Uncharacterised protein [Mycobacteroides abscessus subsp. abscessus]